MALICALRLVCIFAERVCLPFHKPLGALMGSKLPFSSYSMRPENVGVWHLSPIRIVRCHTGGRCCPCCSWSVVEIGCNLDCCSPLLAKEFLDPAPSPPECRSLGDTSPSLDILSLIRLPREVPVQRPMTIIAAHKPITSPAKASKLACMPVAEWAVSVSSHLAMALLPNYGLDEADLREMIKSSEIVTTAWIWAWWKWFTWNQSSEIVNLGLTKLIHVKSKLGNRLLGSRKQNYLNSKLGHELRLQEGHQEYDIIGGLRTFPPHNSSIKAFERAIVFKVTEFETQISDRRGYGMELEKQVLKGGVVRTRGCHRVHHGHCR